MYSRWSRLLALFAAGCLVLAACSAEAEVAGAGGEPDTTAVEEPSVAPTAGGLPTAAPGPTIAPALPSCALVPAFSAADTVSIACADKYAVSPELFASNAGWHLFEAVGGEWVEIDYAKTCCGGDEVPFTRLLSRNRVSTAAITQLCATSLVGPDSVTGCATGNDVDGDFEATWLRVNGLGDHDFGDAETGVLESTEAVFGAADVGLNSECGAGPMRMASFDDFTLQFQDGEFVGWFYRSSSPPLTTPSGVAPGLSESALTELYQVVEIFDETLGKEFFFTVPAGSIGGFFDDAGSSVDSLYAGVTCFFR